MNVFSEIDLSRIIDCNADTDTLQFFTSPATTPEAATPALFSTPQVPPKKPVSQRRKRKRSSRACASCRSRKVRCNLETHGSPCSNCRLDNVECVVPQSRRQRRVERQNLFNRRSPQESNQGSEAGEPFVQSQEIDLDFCAGEGEDSFRFDTLLVPNRRDISEHPLSTQNNNSCDNQKYYHGSTPTIPATRSSFRTHHLLSAPLATSPVKYNLARRIPILPEIFATYPSYLDDTDLSYLHRRGAFCIPSESLQLSLLRAYIEFVHPSMPILDLEDFLLLVKYGEQSHNTGRKQQLSFLLFQAVMFAGAEFASLRDLISAGFESREAARNVLFGRAKLLYDFNTTTDRHPIIQSLLLLSRYPNSLSRPQCHKDAHHYLGLAISISFSLGFHRQTPSLPQCETAEIRQCAAFPGDKRSQWFDIWNVSNFSDHEELQATGLKESVTNIRRIIASEATVLGGKWDHVVLAGISQGAATSVHTLLNLSLPPLVEGQQSSRRLGAFLGFSCRMPFPGRSLVETRKVLALEGVTEDDEVLRNTPVLLEHCADDPLVLVENGRVLRDTLRGFGAQ
ncbi:Cutinase transcription factor 1 beta, partial [Lachnellula arida]